jgi:hypothetical protein
VTPHEAPPRDEWPRAPPLEHSATRWQRLGWHHLVVIEGLPRGDLRRELVVGEVLAR